MNRHPIPVRAALPRLADAARPRQRGVTLLELLVTVAIAAILMGLAAAPLGRMFASNRVQTEASAFMGDLMYARSEAIRRGQAVSLCPSSDALSCLTGTSANSWNSGWIVYAETTSTGCATLPTTGSPATPLRVRAGFKGGDTLGGTSSKGCVSFNRDGFGTNLGSARFVFQVQTSPVVTSSTRCVGIDVGGHVTTTAITSGTTCS